MDKDGELWKTFALALNEEPWSQDRVIKAYEALSEAGLIEEPCPTCGFENTTQDGHALMCSAKLDNN